MTYDTVVSSKESPVGREPEELSESCGPHIEIEMVDLDVVTKHDQLPNPGESFKNVEDM